MKNAVHSPEITASNRIQQKNTGGITLKNHQLRVIEQQLLSNKSIPSAYRANMPMTKTVLVVDDSSSIRATITMTLQSAGFSVIEAEDGNEALTRLNDHRVHLIISDLNMPGMDGMSLLRHVKAEESTRYLPFIMLTTENSPQIRKEGFEAGARVWLTKPFEPLALIDHIYKVVQP